MPHKNTYIYVCMCVYVFENEKIYYMYYIIVVLLLLVVQMIFTKLNALANLFLN